MNAQTLAFGCVTLLTLALLPGCENDSEPLDHQPVSMHLDVQRGADGIVAEVTVTNQTFYPVKYYSGCGCDIGLWVEDHDGNRLRLYCGPDPSCPCWEVNLPPGGSRIARLLFQGQVCVGGELGNMEDVEPGQYEIVASFSYSDDFKPSRDIQNHQEFSWP